MTRILTKQELHNLAMNIVGEELEERGYEFIAINSKLGKHPQFVCIDASNQRYFVIVKAVAYPDNPHNYDMVWMEAFKKHAREQEAKVFYAGVGLQNSENPNKPILLNEEYVLEYAGLQVIETHLN
ncbi:Na(+)-translocating NADH-quinone reductase subunit F [Aquimarina sp. BL5]|uniref:Na(+)-translocating NADH-quinone reductase subunit F n=1 Tax=Aquimarina sp. BL5 TaxID=1714860 RepID=UPI000E4F49FF|nr:Na(+)-translocating NADH-quinone reductase subunit F [Aquimarina sp. BL5]AXT51001.1 Na(+)-translocating NADH-quinone reductase subunit F [Aquimarina sp. BL5]RKM95614.1 Na(+)-translocating NADH-quinone reductase subunit F [Aquimarina sp. BL5]